MSVFFKVYYNSIIEKYPKFKKVLQEFNNNKNINIICKDKDTINKDTINKDSRFENYFVINFQHGFIYNTISITFYDKKCNYKYNVNIPAATSVKLGLYYNPLIDELYKNKELINDLEGAIKLINVVYEKYLFDSCSNIQDFNIICALFYMASLLSEILK